jgi:hypothetical protein
MLSKIKIGSVIVIATMALCAKPITAESPIGEYINWDIIPIPQIIEKVAPMYGQNASLIKKVVFMESGYNPNANHDNNSGIGVTGFHKATFDRWNKTYFKETKEVLIYNSTLDQLKLMSWAFSKGEDYRDDWTTYNRIKGV